jgi:hypothetical protein
VNTLTARTRRLYGAHPVQLALLVACFAVAGYVLHLVGLHALWNPDTWWKSIAVWFVGAAVAHDLVLFPVFAGADRVVSSLSARLARRGRSTPTVPVVNYLRVPLLACGLVTLMFLPGIIRQGSAAYTRANGQTQEPFLGRWLLLCAAILLVALVAYLVANLVARRAPMVVEDPQAPRDAPAPAVPARDPSTGATLPVWALLVVVVLFAQARRRRQDLPTR